MSEIVRGPAPSLPATRADFLALRKIKEKLSINDRIDEIVRVVCEDKRYLQLIEAVYDEQAVEGSLAADNFLAASFIRDYAEANGFPEIAAAKLATIAKAHNVVLRRYELDRHARRRMVNGETVPDNNGND